MLTVLICVGPKPQHKEWLSETLTSVRAQTVPPGEILIIADGARLSQDEVGLDVRIWRTPWVSGGVHAINFGVALAQHDLVLIVASDDIIRPWCIADCLREYERRGDPVAYYWLDIEYSTGEFQSLPSGPAMVTKQLWNQTGGLPIEATIGAADHIFISAINATRGKAARLWQVRSHAPPYWYRVHEGQQQSTQNAKFGSVIGIVRDIISRDWVEKWGS